MKGKDYLDTADKLVRNVYLSKSEDSPKDFLWYLWCGKKSPLFGKDNCAVFESYFISDKSTHVEKKNYYYTHIDTPGICDMILKEFELYPESSHIINGHVPVKTSNGESPIKSDGKLYVIDGGFSRPYQETTGIAGYTLINNSYGFSITEHQPFTSLNDVIENDFDLHSSRTIIDHNARRRMVKDTDNGVHLSRRVQILTELLEAYKSGQLPERIR